MTDNTCYVDWLAGKYSNDPLGLILFLNRQYMELSQEKQSHAYVEIRQLLNVWVNNWCVSSENVGI